MIQSTQLSVFARSMIQKKEKRILRCKQSRTQTNHIFSIFLILRPQTVQWLFAALLFFDKIPHDSPNFDRELWGILSKRVGIFLRRGAGKSNYVKKWILLPFKPEICPPIRGPPLLKSWLFKISEDGGLPHGKAILHKEESRN